MLIFLASLTGPPYEEIFLGAGRNRRHTSGKGKGRRRNPKDANGKTMECDICHSTQHFRRECPRGDGRGADIHSVTWESLLADAADSSVAVGTS
eukprot:3377907-Pyramimonas_sp.AAC.1